LRVLVLNDVPLAEAIGRLRGEWREQSGGELTATSKPWNEVAAAESIDADLLIFPTRYLGELCVRDQLRPVRKSVLDDKSLDFEDIFPLVRRQLITWGGQVMALPLGIDLPNSSNASRLSPGKSLLVAVAANVVSANRSGDVFDPDTMKPRITEPVFVEALRRFLSAEERPAPLEPPAKRRVPVLGLGDRLAAVTTASRNAASAFRLLAWLATPDVSTQFARIGDGTMPVRKSLAESPVWYDSKLGAGERAELGKTSEAALSGNECLIVPRIPGVDQYMAALDEAVANVVAGQAKPEDALKQAAQKWEKITDTHGRETQRRAYLKHLGISE
jgi:hypothetical protein